MDRARMGKGYGADLHGETILMSDSSQAWPRLMKVTVYFSIAPGVERGCSQQEDMIIIGVWVFSSSDLILAYSTH